MKTIIIGMLTGLLVAGCGNATDQDSQIRLGMSREQTVSHFKGAGTHQFTVLQNTNMFECVSYSFKRPFIRYYFVFKNDQLHSILDPQPFFEWQINVIPDGRRVEVQAPWSTEDRLRRVIESPTLSEQAFAGELERRLAAAESRKPDFNVLPAFVLLAPLIVPDAIQRNATQQVWQQRYDPRKIKLGMAEVAVADVLGKPMYTITDRNAKTHAYGPAESLSRNTGRPYLGPTSIKYWVAVVFQEGMVTRILSNDLFNDEKIVHPDNEEKNNSR